MDDVMAYIKALENRIKTLEGLAGVLPPREAMTREEIEQRVLVALQSNATMIPALKLYRDLAGVSLRESREYIDGLMARVGA